MHPVYEVKLSHHRRHRCPHKPNNNSIIVSSHQPCALSEYTEQFKKYSSHPRKPIKPPMQRTQDYDSKMEAITVSRQDYRPHPLIPRTPQPPPVYNPPQGTVSSDTEYRKTYEGRQSIPPKSCRPKHVQKEKGGAFNHKSIQSTDFVAFDIPERENFAVRHAYEPPKVPLEGRSTIQDDFVDFGAITPTAMIKPPQTAKISTDPFDGTSCYRQSFTPQPIPTRYQRPKEEYKASNEQFMGDSTYKKDFPGYTGKSPAPSMKPPPATVASESPFDGTTVSRLSYVKWDLPEKFVRSQEVYTPPTEAFIAQSTFQADFPDYGHREATKPIRPKPKSRDNTPAFRAISTQMADFPLWDPSQIQRSTPVMHKGAYQPSTGKFDAISTSQDHYKGIPGTPAPTAKPIIQAYERKNFTADSTTYRTSFSRSGIPICPANILFHDPQASNKYAFSHSNPTTGHVYFKPVKGALESARVPEPVRA